MKLIHLPCRALALGLLLIATAIGDSTGCASLGDRTVATAGTVVYVRGELDATLGNPFEAVDKAANTALTNLRFVKTSEKKDALVSLYEVRTAEDKKVSVKVYRIKERLTKVEIRIDLFGSEMMSRTILEKIQAEL
jgi:hypothetical protein